MTGRQMLVLTGCIAIGVVAGYLVPWLVNGAQTSPFHLIHAWVHFLFWGWTIAAAVGVGLFMTIGRSLGGAASVGRCPTCGLKMRTDSETCKHCGSPRNKPAKQTTTRPAASPTNAAPSHKKTRLVVLDSGTQQASPPKVLARTKAKLAPAGSGAGLPSLQSLGYSPPCELVETNMALLDSSDWRDWDRASMFIRYARIPAAVAKLHELLTRPQAAQIPNVAMLTVGTLFTIGGPESIAALQTLTAFSNGPVLARAPVCEWAEKLLSGLHHLARSASMTDQIADLVCRSRQLRSPEDWEWDTSGPEWDERDLSRLSVSQLWGVVAADPGMLFTCMSVAADVLDAAIEAGKKVVREDARCAREFGIIGSEVKLPFYQIESYIGYYPDNETITDAHRRINRIVCHSLGGWSDKDVSAL